MRVCLLALAIAVPAHLQAAQVIDAVTQYGFTSEPRTLQLENICRHCVRYEWQLLSFERRQIVDAGQVQNRDHQANECKPGVMNVLSATMRLPRTGHYYVEARGCTAAACSAWVTSMDSASAMVGCVPRAWWIYGTVQPPGNPVFH